MRILAAVGHFVAPFVMMSVLAASAWADDGHPRPPASAAPADDGQWTMPAKNYASTRYSELTEITADNVKNLQPAFTFSMGVNKGQEAAPLIVGGMMYIVSPYPNVV